MPRSSAEIAHSHLSNITAEFRMCEADSVAKTLCGLAGKYAGVALTVGRWVRSFALTVTLCSAAQANTGSSATIEFTGALAASQAVRYKSFCRASSGWKRYALSVREQKAPGLHQKSRKLQEALWGSNIR